MKKTIFLIAATTIMCVTTYAQEAHTQQMQAAVTGLDNANTMKDYQQLANDFLRIADIQKTLWLPYYYAGLALTMPGWTDTKLDKDANAEKIKAVCDKADALAQDNADKAEILAIRNMTATQQMLVDPQNRWATYGQEGAGYLNKAKQLNSNNPRLYYLEGAGIFGTPEQFGGGKTKAKPVLQKAVELFKADHPKPMYPRWGQKQAEDMLAQCQ